MNITLTKVSDQELARRIDAAQSSVVLYAPGVKGCVAESIGRAIHRLRGHVKVVLDVSQKSVDMGFLDPKTVRYIWSEQLAFLNGQKNHSGDDALFFHLSGLRIGILAIDGNAALMYAPFAENMEDEFLEMVQSCPSGIDVILQEVEAPHKIVEIVAVDSGKVKTFEATALQSAKKLSEIKREYEDKIQQAEAEKEEAEKRAEEAEKRAEEAGKKAVEEYKAQFKIRRVNFSISSQPDAINRKRVDVPSMFLVGLGNDVEQNLAAKYKIFPDVEEIKKLIENQYKGEAISDFVNLETAIREQFLIQVPKFGSYLRIKDEAAFERKIEELKSLGIKVGEHIRHEMSERIGNALESLFSILSAQWASARNPWTREYYRKHPDDYRSERDVFMDTMVVKTQSMVEKFKPEVTCYSTPIDEKLAENKDFLAALNKVLAKRNQIVGTETVKIEDLICMNKPKPSNDKGLE